MSDRKYNSDPKELLEEGQAIMSSTDESKYFFRVFAVNMVLSGATVSSVSQSAGLTKASVTRWVKLVDEVGFDALKSAKQPGRPAKLLDEQISQIDTVLQSDPQDYGYKVWDGPTLASYIKDTFDVQLSVRQCQRLFHNLGYSLIRPQSFPSKGIEDTAEREAVKKTVQNKRR